jgi:inhibitor of KinA sporulation pathway (predicted exonuclease)
MTTTINEETTVTLLDGTTFSVRPLKISLLRDFMKTFDKISEVAEDNSKSLDVLLDCVQIALRQYAPEIAEDKTKLEDLLDLPLVYKIVEEASGIVLSDGSILGNLG